MTYAPVTAFLRPIDAGQLHRAQAVARGADSTGARTVNKWETLRELVAGRAAFGLSDRDLAVLEALVSFHPGTTLGGNDGPPLVHPSNVSICERLKGMASSTMRRHLARLVETGLILRRDSPNGKRYARRYAGETVAFGFDLSPLIARQAEILAAGESARAAAEHLSRLRETVSLMRRDLAGLAGYGVSLRPDLALWDQLSDLAALCARALRRKLEASDLDQLQRELLIALNKARDVLDCRVVTQDSSSNDAKIGQHHQNSKADSYELEPCPERAKVGPDHADDLPDEMESEVATIDANLPNIPLAVVLSACTEILNYADGPIRHWHQLVRAADLVRPMMGISPSAWNEARAAMGPEQAAAVLAAMLERFADIRSPGGYLRSLTTKAETGAFSCGPMIMALMRKAA